MSFTSATSIARRRGINLLSEYTFVLFFLLCFGDFFRGHAQKYRHFCFRSKNCPHHRVQRPQFLINGLNLWLFDNALSNFVHICAHAQNGYFRAFGKKSDPIIRSGDLNFLQDRCIPTTEWRSQTIFGVFVILTLWPWPLPFWHWECECVITEIKKLHIVCSMLYKPTRKNSKN